MKKLSNHNISESLTSKVRNKEALVIHDDLNICGGSERLAAITIDLLSEIGFSVDLATFKNPNVRKTQKLFELDLRLY